MNPRFLARVARALAFLAAGCALCACDNSPYPKGAAATNTLFYTFDERSPRYLDPTASYANPESAYTYQIYEPLYGYHYLKRPYQLDAQGGRRGGQAVLPRQGRPAPA